MMQMYFAYHCHLRMLGICLLFFVFGDVEGLLHNAHFAPCYDQKLHYPDRYIGRMTSRYHSMESSNDEEEIQDSKKNAEAFKEEIDVDSVSEAEALLACRSYLQRRNRLNEWTQFEQRKAMREIDSQRPHYFWSNPAELVYLQQDQTKTTNDESKDSAGSETDRIAFNAPKADQNEFTFYPAEPTDDYIRRSQASKRTWSDPEWKAKWHERRWGAKSSRPTKTQQNRRQKRLEARVRALGPYLLGSPELASLTEDEIADAISTYVRANRKRVISRSKTRAKRKEALTTPKSQQRLARDSLFGEDPEALKEAQRNRSERAARAYQTRLRNNNDLNDKTSKRSGKKIGTPPTGKTAKDALLRIESNLDNEKLPDASDIELVSAPLKLSKRRETFRRILKERFGLRGKCVPIDLDDLNSDKAFVTSCAIADLGNFVLFLIRNANDDDGITPQ